MDKKTKQGLIEFERCKVQNLSVICCEKINQIKS